MAGMGDVRDLRFEGMEIPELRNWIGEIKDGRGPESMNTAARALERAVQVVVDLDDTLNKELGKLRIDWEGYGGATAQDVTQRQQDVLRDSQEPLEASTRSVHEQGQGYSTAKNGLPNPGELQHHQSENFLEWSGGAFGYESDYDQEAKRIDGQKKAAQAALGSYRDTTVQQADAFRPMPEMTAPATVTPQSAGAAASGTSGFPAAASVGGSGSAGGSVGGGAAGNGSVGGSPGGGWIADDGGIADDGARGDDGAGRPGGHSDGGGDGGTSDEKKGGRPDDHPEGDGTPISGGTTLGVVAGGAAVAGAGALVAGRLMGGGTSAPGTPARGPAFGRAGSSGIGGGPGDTTAGRSPTGRPGPGSLMAPAATRGRRHSGADDGEHEDKYAVEETHFDDNRLVAPPVLGESSARSDGESTSETQRASDDEQG